MAKYRFFLTNFGWYTQDEAETLEEAKETCKRIGFDVRVVDDQGESVAVWDVIGGWKELGNGWKNNQVL